MGKQKKPQLRLATPEEIEQERLSSPQSLVEAEEPQLTSEETLELQKQVLDQMFPGIFNPPQPEKKQELIYGDDGQSPLFPSNKLAKNSGNFAILKNNVAPPDKLADQVKQPGKIVLDAYDEALKGEFNSKYNGKGLDLSGSFNTITGEQTPSVAPAFIRQMGTERLKKDVRRSLEEDFAIRDESGKITGFNVGAGIIETGLNNASMLSRWTTWLTGSNLLIDFMKGYNFDENGRIRIGNYDLGLPDEQNYLMADYFSNRHTMQDDSLSAKFGAIMVGQLADLPLFWGIGRLVGVGFSAISPANAFALSQGGMLARGVGKIIKSMPAIGHVGKVITQSNSFGGKLASSFVMNNTIINIATIPQLVDSYQREGGGFGAVLNDIYHNAWFSAVASFGGTVTGHGFSAMGKKIFSNPMSTFGNVLRRFPETTEMGLGSMGSFGTGYMFPMIGGDIDPETGEMVFSPEDRLATGLTMMAMHYGSPRLFKEGLLNGDFNKVMVSVKDHQRAYERAQTGKRGDNILDDLNYYIREGDKVYLADNIDGKFEARKDIPAIPFDKNTADGFRYITEVPSGYYLTMKGAWQRANTDKLYYEILEGFDRSGVRNEINKSFRPEDSDALLSSSAWILANTTEMQRVTTGKLIKKLELTPENEAKLLNYANEFNLGLGKTKEYVSYQMNKIFNTTDVEYNLEGEATGKAEVTSDLRKKAMNLAMDIILQKKNRAHSDMVDEELGIKTPEPRETIYVEGEEVPVERNVSGEAHISGVNVPESKVIVQPAVNDKFVKNDKVSWNITIDGEVVNVNGAILGKSKSKEGFWMVATSKGVREVSEADLTKMEKTGEQQKKAGKPVKTEPEPEPQGQWSPKNKTLTIDEDTPESRLTDDYISKLEKASEKDNQYGRWAKKALESIKKNPFDFFKRKMEASTSEETKAKIKPIAEYFTKKELARQQEEAMTKAESDKLELAKLEEEVKSIPEKIVYEPTPEETAILKKYGDTSTPADVRGKAMREAFDANEPLLRLISNKLGREGLDKDALLADVLKNEQMYRNASRIDGNDSAYFKAVDEEVRKFNLAQINKKNPPKPKANPKLQETNEKIKQLRDRIAEAEKNKPEVPEPKQPVVEQTTPDTGAEKPAPAVSLEEVAKERAVEEAVEKGIEPTDAVIKATELRVAEEIVDSEYELRKRVDYLNKYERELREEVRPQATKEATEEMGKVKPYEWDYLVEDIMKEMERMEKEYNTDSYGMLHPNPKVSRDIQKKYAFLEEKSDYINDISQNIDRIEEVSDLTDMEIMDKMGGVFLDTGNQPTAFQREYVRVLLEEVIRRNPNRKKVDVGRAAIGNYIEEDASPAMVNKLKIGATKYEDLFVAKEQVKKLEGAPQEAVKPINTEPVEPRKEGEATQDKPKVEKRKETPLEEFVEKNEAVRPILNKLNDTMDRFNEKYEYGKPEKVVKEVNEIYDEAIKLAKIVDQQRFESGEQILGGSKTKPETIFGILMDLHGFSRRESTDLLNSIFPPDNRITPKALEKMIGESKAGKLLKERLEQAGFTSKIKKSAMSVEDTLDVPEGDTEIPKSDEYVETVPKKKSSLEDESRVQEMAFRETEGDVEKITGEINEGTGMGEVSLVSESTKSKRRAELIGEIKKVLGDLTEATTEKQFNEGIKKLSSHKFHQSAGKNDRMRENAIALYTDMYMEKITGGEYKPGGANELFSSGLRNEPMNSEQTIRASKDFENWFGKTYPQLYKEGKVSFAFADMGDNKVYGSTQFEDGSVLITFNTRGMTKDTPVEEYGHLAVMLLGKEADWQGMLKDTGLWDGKGSMWDLGTAESPTPQRQAHEELMREFVDWQNGWSPDRAGMWQSFKETFEKVSNGFKGKGWYSKAEYFRQLAEGELYVRDGMFVDIRKPSTIATMNEYNKESGSLQAFANDPFEYVNPEGKEPHQFKLLDNMEQVDPTDFDNQTQSQWSYKMDVALGKDVEPMPSDVLYSSNIPKVPAMDIMENIFRDQIPSRTTEMIGSSLKNKVKTLRNNISQFYHRAKALNENGFTPAWDAQMTYLKTHANYEKMIREANDDLDYFMFTAQNERVINQNGVERKLPGLTKEQMNEVSVAYSFIMSQRSIDKPIRAMTAQELDSINGTYIERNFDSEAHTIHKVDVSKLSEHQKLLLKDMSNHYARLEELNKEQFRALLSSNPDLYQMIDVFKIPSKQLPNVMLKSDVAPYQMFRYHVIKSPIVKLSEIFTPSQMPKELLRKLKVSPDDLVEWSDIRRAVSAVKGKLTPQAITAIENITKKFASGSFKPRSGESVESYLEVLANRIKPHLEAKMIKPEDPSLMKNWALDNPKIKWGTSDIWDYATFKAKVLEPLVDDAGQITTHSPVVQYLTNKRFNKAFLPNYMSTVLEPGRYVVKIENGDDTMWRQHYRTASEASKAVKNIWGNKDKFNEWLKEKHDASLRERAKETILEEYGEVLKEQMGNNKEDYDTTLNSMIEQRYNDLKADPKNSSFQLSDINQIKSDSILKEFDYHAGQRAKLSMLDLTRLVNNAGLNINDPNYAPLMKILMSRGFTKRWLDKQDKAGYSSDIDYFIKSTKSYTQDFYKMYEKKLLTSLFKDIENSPQMANEKYRSEANLTRDFIYTSLHPTAIEHPMIGQFKNLAYASVTANASYQVANRLQFFQMGTGVAARVFGWEAPKEIGRAFKDSRKMVKLLEYEIQNKTQLSHEVVDREGIDYSEFERMREAQKMGMFEGMVTEEMLMKDVYAQGGAMKVTREVLRKLNANVEKNNRAAATLLGLRMANREGNVKDPATYAMSINAEINIVPRIQIPMAIQKMHGWARTTLSAAYMFGSFPHNQLHVLSASFVEAARTLSQGKPSKKAISAFVFQNLPLLITSGLIGLPFMNDVKEGLAYLGIDGELAVRKAIKSVGVDSDVADVMLYGLPTIAGIDMTKSMGMGDVGRSMGLTDIVNLVSGDEVYRSSRTVLGGFSMIANLPISIKDYVLRGNEVGYYNAFMEQPPGQSIKLFRGLANAYRQSEQGILDKTGKVLAGKEEMTPYINAMTAVGFKPFAETKAKQIESSKDMETRVITNAKKEFGERLQMALRNQDNESIREIIGEINEWNKEYFVHYREALNPRRLLLGAAESVRNKTAYTDKQMRTYLKDIDSLYR